MKSTAMEWIRVTGLFCWILALLVGRGLQALGAGEPAFGSGSPAKEAKAHVMMVKGSVEVSRAGAKSWTAARTNTVLSVGDRLRTGIGAQAAVRLTDSSIVRLSEATTIEVQHLPAGSNKPGFDVKGGMLHFFSRERPQNEVRWRTPVASGAIRGTEFTVRVEDNGRTEVTVLEGEVELSNEAGSATGTAGHQVAAANGLVPETRPALDTAAAIQWCLYYPGVLDVAELTLDAEATQTLESSLAAWRQGDIQQAFARYPQGRDAKTESERVYRAALALGVGGVGLAQKSIEDLNTPLAGALKQVIATVQFRPWSRSSPPALATEWLAESYYRQANWDLKGARKSAAQATETSPEFGFAWARLAELEFSLGRLWLADQALERALALSPSNAQAWTLKGFVVLGRDQTVEADAAFERAVGLDGALANAWLGRGLCRFRQRRIDEGLSDLQAAAMLEPNRSLLRSYLGKGYQQAGSSLRNFQRRAELLGKAAKELALARQFDAEDPTPWLYQALLDHQRYATAEAIENLQQSVELNQQRGLYRSRLLLDQDQAVRSANLGRIYQDAGFDVVSRRESARAVMQDYGNASAHLNLASSFDALRDPTRFNLRHESEWFNEHLLSSLLAPVDGGSLSQHLSQQEYSRVFVSDRFGGAATTEYQSSGDFRQVASQFGVIDRFGYAADLEYDTRNGVRPNNDLDHLDLTLRLKQQVGERDSALLIVNYQDYESGDQFQYYDPASARQNYRLRYAQEPTLLAGYHREWSPGVHTLFLGGRLTDEQEVANPAEAQWLLVKPNPPFAPSATSARMDRSYGNRMELYVGEWNQIVQGEKHTDVFGMRLIGGDFEARSTLSNPLGFLTPFVPAPLVSLGGGSMERFSSYWYHTWTIRESLLLTAGLAYDRLTSPLNYRRAPVQAGEERLDKWSPKAALLWMPANAVTFRMAYAQALGGVSYDEGVRLEPTQLAGFSQSHRSLISESVAGAVEAPRYDLWGAGLDLRFGAKTFVTLEARLMRERVDRWTGAINLNPGGGGGSGGQTIWLAPFHESLRYRERSLALTANHILNDDWFLEGGYEISRSALQQRQAHFPDRPATDRSWTEESQLQVFRAGLSFSPRSGWFGRAVASWYVQENESTLTNRPGDDVPEVSMWVGWQFPMRRGEVAVGVLNLLDEDYRLYPLNYYWEMARERTFCARLRWHF